MLTKMYQVALMLFKEAHDAYEQLLVDGTEEPAVLQKHNIAAFCIATLFSADQGHQDQKLFSHSTHTLFSTTTYAPTEPIPVTSDDASKMYEKSVTTVRDIGKSRNPELENRDALVMQQFCVAQESGTPEFASLLSQTLICLCNYLNQRSSDQTSLHPHNDGVPHRHSQVFNRTWCRLAELRFEEPGLRFALHQVIAVGCVRSFSCGVNSDFSQVEFFLEKHRSVASLLADCEYANRKAKKIARPKFKKIMDNKLLFLKRYRISKLDPSHISDSSFVIEATDTRHGMIQDEESGHRKVALKFFESKFDFDQEKGIRDEICSHHRNQTVISGIVSSEQEDVSQGDAPPSPSPLSSDQLGNHEGTKKADDAPSHLEGVLMKNARSGLRHGKHWTERYFELNGSNLVYRERRGKQSHKTMNLNKGNQCTATEPDVAVKHDYSFPFIIRNSEQVLIQLAAKTQELRDLWIQGINKACQVSFFQQGCWILIGCSYI
jgi:hypothetical protein